MFLCAHLGKDGRTWQDRNLRLHSPTDYQCPQATEISLENSIHVPKTWVMDINYHLREFGLQIFIGNDQKKLSKGYHFQGSHSEKKKEDIWSHRIKGRLLNLL